MEEVPVRMRIITEPGVQVLSAPLCFPQPQYPLPKHENMAESLIATVDGLCAPPTKWNDSTVEERVHEVLNQRHPHALGHVGFTLHITGVSRHLAQELRGEWGFSLSPCRDVPSEPFGIVLDPYYAELYTRLNSEGPQCMTETETMLLDGFLAACMHSLQQYSTSVGLMLSFSDDSREQQALPLDAITFQQWVRDRAAPLLPEAMETRFVMTGSLRAWRTLFVRRSHRKEQPEMRRLAQALYEVVRPLAPNAFDLALGKRGGYYELQAV